jgi:predicted nucleic acid-binding protein
MQRYCLETSFIIDFLREKEDAIEKYIAIKKQKLETSSVVAWEILRGPKLTGRVKEYKVAVKLFERLNILPFTLTSARIASEIELELKGKGRNVNLIDVLIAATAIENNSKLVTRDEGYENIQRLEIEFCVCV